MSFTAASAAAVEISNGVARVHKARLGRGPELVRTTIDGELVVCLLEGGLTTVEQTLARIGRTELIAQRRAALDQALESELSMVVSNALHRPVRSAMSALDQRTGMRALMFILGPAIEARFCPGVAGEAGRLHADGGQNNSRSSSRSMI